MSLARDGWSLTITARSDADLGACSAELLAAGAPQVVVQAADLAQREALPELVGRHATAYAGKMNALVLNAGVGTAGQVADFPLRRIDKTLDVNVVAALVLIQESLPLLRRGAEQDPLRGSSIIGISSITGVYPEAGLGVYGASKAALASLLETVNLEEANRQVRATSISPGYVATDMSSWVTDTVPADEMIKVDDVVEVVDTVLSLSANTRIPSIVMTRSTSGGYHA